MNVSIVIHSLHTSFPVTILGMHLIGWSVATELCHQVARQQANIVVQQLVIARRVLLDLWKCQPKWTATDSSEGL